MTNIKLTIEYHGLPYSGWQYQKNEKTVQKHVIESKHMQIIVNIVQKHMFCIKHK